MSTKVEWVRNGDGSQGMSWNPLVGCSKKSTGCKNCYAERMAKRLKAMGISQYQDAVDDEGWTGKVQFVEHLLNEPLRQRKPNTYFVCSMSDLFHENVPEEIIWRIIEIAWKAKQHTFYILTKRAERLFDILSHSLWWLNDTPENIGIGVSVEDQATADQRLPYLAYLPAAIRFVSYEPALGPVDFTNAGVNEFIDWIDWVICGGESGPGARPMHPDWARLARDQCVADGVSFFFKQWGTYVPQGQFWHWSKRKYRFDDGTLMFKVGKKDAGRWLDGREWNQLPW